MSSPVPEYTCRNGHTGHTYNDKVGKKVCRACRHARYRTMIDKQRRKLKMHDKLVEFVRDVAEHGYAHFQSSGIAEARALLEEVNGQKKS